MCFPFTSREWRLKNIMHTRHEANFYLSFRVYNDFTLRKHLITIENCKRDCLDSIPTKTNAIRNKTCLLDIEIART